MQKIAVVIALLGGNAFADRVMVPENFGPTLPAPPLAQPKPVVEIAQVGASIAGTWKCTGEITKLSIKLVLDGAWIEMTGNRGAASFTRDVTFDAIGKQWTAIERTGAGYAVVTSLGEQRGTWTWTAGERREAQQLTKTRLSFVTETNVRGTWTKTAESTCHK